MGPYALQEPIRGIDNITDVVNGELLTRQNHYFSAVELRYGLSSDPGLLGKRFLQSLYLLFDGTRAHVFPFLDIAKMKSEDHLKAGYTLDAWFRLAGVRFWQYNLGENHINDLPRKKIMISLPHRIVRKVDEVRNVRAKMKKVNLVLQFPGGVERVDHSLSLDTLLKAVNFVKYGERDTS